jgi:GTP-binding protein HflX
VAKGQHQVISNELEKAVLVYMNEDESEDRAVEEELVGLCEAAQVEPVASIRQRLERPYRPTYIGSGKVEEVKLLAKETQADIVLMDAEITGIQQRNLEEALGCRVVDRTQLILDIFARRARTREGMLQVELAQLTTLLPKLMSMYTKFERQRGGIGVGMRGPGETKLESDRRMVRERIAKLSEEIEEVKRHRDQQRAGRRKHPYPFASIVGYTSAGKSTLMNHLAGTDLLADAMPFATLDPTTRKIDLPDGYALFLTDTVGFIRNLPTNLVAAFRSTLEEVMYADFLIHVVDISNPSWEIQFSAVQETLDILDSGELPIITIFNKADRVDPDIPASEGSLSLNEALESFPNSVAISALTGKGIDDLLKLIKLQVKDLLGFVMAVIPYEQGRLVQECHQFGRVLKEEYRENGIYIEAELVTELRQLVAKYAVE